MTLLTIILILILASVIVMVVLAATAPAGYQIEGQGFFYGTPPEDRGR